MFDIFRSIEPTLRAGIRRCSSRIRVAFTGRSPRNSAARRSK